MYTQVLSVSSINDNRPLEFFLSRISFENVITITCTCSSLFLINPSHTSHPALFCSPLILLSSNLKSTQEIQASCTDVCESCEKKVYPLEKVETNNKIFHKQCFRCQQCNCVLRMDTFTLNNGKLYCIPHFKQLFITRGNYDEGFGVDPHKNKWTTSSSNPTSPSPIAVSNGDL